MVFGGGGSATLAVVLDPKHDLHRVLWRVVTKLSGVCVFCANSYRVQPSRPCRPAPFWFKAARFSRFEAKPTGLQMPDATGGPFVLNVERWQQVFQARPGTIT